MFWYTGIFLNAVVILEEQLRWCEAAALHCLLSGSMSVGAPVSVRGPAGGRALGFERPGVSPGVSPVCAS